MKEDVFENPVELRTAVATPHFDDRRVVQRAQPVVPLNEIRTKLRLRRLWFFGGAFAIAIGLGAASALLAVHIKRIAAGSQITQIEEPVVEQQAATAEAQTLPAEIDSVADSTVAEEAEPVKPIVTAPKREQATAAERPRIVDRDRRTGSTGVEPSEEEELEQIREAVLYDRWQERRLRRAARRERRNRDDRDLSRVDEIFEGPRQPERP